MQFVEKLYLEVQKISQQYVETTYPLALALALNTPSFTMRFLATFRRQRQLNYLRLLVIKSLLAWRPSLEFNKESTVTMKHLEDNIVQWTSY